MSFAPILLVVYNRPEHFQQTLKALQKNILADQSDLFIYSDGAKPGQEDLVAQVRQFAHLVTGFLSVTVIERPQNIGLAANIIEGVTTLVNRYDQVIVLEDDLITSPYFLSFMNDGLTLYKHDVRVMNVQAHVLFTKTKLPETFFIRFANSWGWGTWKRAWDSFEPDGKKLLHQLEQRHLTRAFDFDGRYPFTRMLRRQIAGQNHSWAIRWNATIFLSGGVSFNAGRSLVKNIGTDGSGTNFTTPAGYYTVLDTNEPIHLSPLDPVEESPVARRAIGKVYQYEYSKITKGLRLLKSWKNALLRWAFQKHKK